ncbi:MAG: hypothetical protein F6K09_29440, partial [Merismopedia sp. SIO2A8]|nr:hypothetical protein [Merismopedia sp. SIO2A8]
MSPFNDSSPSDPDNQQVYRELIIHLSQFFSEETITERLNVEQMFILVDGVLPIEACLYYQVLPLFLDGSRLHLGMVNPSDTTASDYVRRIVSYLNYSLITRRISSPALQAALSAYLKYSDSQSSRTAQQIVASSPTTKEDHPSHSNITHNIETDNQETLVLDSSVVIDQDEVQAKRQTSQYPVDPPILPLDELTCIDPEETEIIQLDDQERSSPLPEDDILLGALDGVNATGGDTAETRQDATIQVKTSIMDDPGEVNTEETEETEETEDDEIAWDVERMTETAEAIPLKASTGESTPSASIELGTSSPSEDSGSNEARSSPQSSADPLAVQIEAKHLEQAIDHLQHLPPRELLRELLVRAMSGGIGRLYFERKSSYGRILWSQSGVLQSAVDNIPGTKFQAIINEFKRLTRLPLLPLRKTKQVELERFYKGSRVLLRFRFIPGQHG